MFTDISIQLFDQQYRSNKRVREFPVHEIANDDLHKYVSNDKKSREPALVLFTKDKKTHLFTVPAASAPQSHERYGIIQRILGGVGLYNPIGGVEFGWDPLEDLKGGNRKMWEEQVAQFTGTL